MPIEISLATASIRISGADAPVSGHTLALALYLAAEGRPVSRARLGSTLFHADSRARENAVKVYVHRLRSIIGKESIIRRADGYAYSDRICVDLPEIEAFVAKVEDGVLHSTAMRIRARRILSELSTGRPDAVLRWEWFEPVEQRLRALQNRLHSFCEP